MFYQGNIKPDESFLFFKNSSVNNNQIFNSELEDNNKRNDFNKTILRINYGKPARLLIKTSSIALECNMQGLNDLWNVISVIEKQKRQKQK